MNIQPTFFLFKQILSQQFNEYVFTEILDVFLDKLIWRFEWWSLKENYIIYHKRYFDLYVDPTQRRISDGLCEKSTQSREIFMHFASNESYWMELDFRKIQERYLSLDCDNLSPGFFSDMISAKNHAQTHSLKFKIDTLCIDLREFYISTVHQSYIFNNIWNDGGILYFYSL